MGAVDFMGHFGLASLDNLSYCSDMQTEATTWKHIDAIAERLGVKSEARRKWRERGAVPHRWRLPILQQGAGILAPADFEPAPSTTPQEQST
ncbi:MAG: hypothetical protein ACRDBH_07090 [Bosea sp. (in: a-proteobacteria)]